MTAVVRTFQLNSRQFERLRQTHLVRQPTPDGEQCLRVQFNLLESAIASVYLVLGDFLPQRGLPPPLKYPRRVSIREAAAALGIGRTTFIEQGWLSLFTPFMTLGRQHRICTRELDAALKHADPIQAKAAILQCRATLKRLDTLKFG